MEGEVTATLWVEIRELREFPGLGIVEEFGQWNDITTLARGDSPGVKKRVWEESSGIAIIDPADALFRQSLED